jgi:hypothetical protein
MATKKQLVLLASFLLVSVIIGLSGCAPGAGANTGSGTPPGGKPDSVRIDIDQPAPPGEKGQSTVTLTSITLVQRLYATIYALPTLPAQRACTTELGPHYTLTFFQADQSLVSMRAMRDGCRPVTISGETGDRQGTEDFWKQLDQAIYDGTPPANPKQLAIAKTLDQTQPLQTAQITSAEAVQRLYDAILALPLLDKGSTCGNTTLPDYQLLFQADNQAIPAAIDATCQTVTLQGGYQSRGGTYQMDAQFNQLFAATIADAPFAPARPDQLTLTIQKVSGTSGQSNMTDAALMQQLYQKVFTLQPTQPQPDCPSGDDKLHGKGVWYALDFAQWGLSILQVSAYEGSCTAVSRSVTGQTLQGDQAFWSLVHQAAGQ